MGSKVPGRQKNGSDETIARISLFAYLTPEELSDIGKIILEKRFSKNEFILMEQDTPNYMYIMYIVYYSVFVFNEVVPLLIYFPRHNYTA